MKRFSIDELSVVPTPFRVDKTLPKDWSGTLEDLLDHPNMEHNHKMYLLCRVLNHKTLKLFAIDCAKEALKLLPSPIFDLDTALLAAEQFADGVIDVKALNQASIGAHKIAQTGAGLEKQVATIVAYACYETPRSADAVAELVQMLPGKNKTAELMRQKNKLKNLMKVHEV